MNHKTILAPIFFLTVCSMALSCSDSESRMPFADAATAVINLARAEAPDQALSVDTPIRGGGMPVGGPLLLFDRVKVEITGPDIGTIVKNFPFSNTVSFDVPPGPVRRFEVTVYTAPYDPDNSPTWTAANSFRGVTTVNLPAGASVSIPVLMSLHETKIVVPDKLNYRIVQFNRVADVDATWITSDSVQYPEDIDFDARGRIFVAINPGGANNIYRMETINETPQPCLMTDESNDIVSITVDRKRNLLYYATDNHDGTAALTGIDLTSLPATGSPQSTVSNMFYSITALDVADDGSLYIAGMDKSDNQILFRFNPADGIFIGQAFTNSENSWFYPLDVMVRGGSVYVLNNPEDNNGFALLNFNFGPSAVIGDLGFTLGVHFGSVAQVARPPEKGLFYGPKKFAVRREDGFVIIDEGEFFSPGYLSINRLVFTDFDPLRPWYTFGNTDSFNPDFQFYDYSMC